LLPTTLKGYTVFKFSRTCQAREIGEMKGTRKNGFYSIRYRVSADTHKYRWVSVSADTYLSIGADTSSPVVCLPVNTVATHAYSFKPIFLRVYPAYAYNLHTPKRCTKSHFQYKKLCTARYRYNRGRQYRYRVPTNSYRTRTNLFIYRQSERLTLTAAPCSPVKKSDLTLSCDNPANTVFSLSIVRRRLIS